MVTVGEGIKTYLNLFFAPEGGYISLTELTESSPQNYLLLLELFYLIESFMKMLDKGIEELNEQQKKLSQLDARGGCILPEKTFQDFIRISRDMLDKKYRNVHREVGDRF